MTFAVDGLRFKKKKKSVPKSTPVVDQQLLNVKSLLPQDHEACPEAADADSNGPNCAWFPWHTGTEGKVPGETEGGLCNSRNVDWVSAPSAVNVQYFWVEIVEQRIWIFHSFIHSFNIDDSDVFRESECICMRVRVLFC